MLLFISCFSYINFSFLTYRQALILCVRGWERVREREEKKHRRQNRALQSLRIRGLSLHPTKKHKLRSAGVPCFDNSQAFSHFTSGEHRRLSRKKWNNALRNLHLAHLILSSRGSDGKLHLSSSTGWTDRRCRKEWIWFLNSLANEPLPHVSGLIFRCRG